MLGINYVGFRISNIGIFLKSENFRTRDGGFNGLLKIL